MKYQKFKKGCFLKLVSVSYTHQDVYKRQGEYVMGTNTQTGNSERIYVGTDLISISPDNSVMINGENKYKFNIVDFENYDNLTKYGNNLYKGEGGFNSNNYSIKPVSYTHLIYCINGSRSNINNSIGNWFAS